MPFLIYLATGIITALIVRYMRGPAPYYRFWVRIIVAWPAVWTLVYRNYNRDV